MADIAAGIPNIFNPVFSEQSKAALKSQKKDKKIAGGKTGAFSRLLYDSKSNMDTRITESQRIDSLPVSSETITMLLDDVHSSGDALSKKQTAGEIVNYKRAVKNFLYFVSRNGFSSEKQAGKINYKTGEQTVHTLVRVIDQKLEKLAIDIMSTQLKHIDLLSRLEEIKGMLIDMLE